MAGGGSAGSGVEELDERVGMAMVVALPVGERAFAPGAPPLALIEKDRQRSHQGEIPCRGGMADLAMVFALGVIAPVMLFGFDAPVATHQAEQGVGIGFVEVETADAVTGFPGGLEDLTPPQVIDLLVEAKDLRGSGQTERRAIDGLAPEFTVFHAAMAFIQGLRLRGENRPRGAVWLWRARGVDCP